MMNRTCFACGEPREKRELAFEPGTLKTYCNDKFICTNPEELPATLHKRLEDASAEIPGMDKLLGKSISARLTSFPFLAVHLNNIMEAEEITVNEALIHILNKDFEQTQRSDDFREKLVEEAKRNYANYVSVNDHVEKTGELPPTPLITEGEPWAIPNPEPLPELEEVEDNGAELMNDTKEEEEDDEWEI
jgi:hypothetical protein